jgi:hypothetical protein
MISINDLQREFGNGNTGSELPSLLGYRQVIANTGFTDISLTSFYNKTSISLPGFNFLATVPGNNRRGFTVKTNGFLDSLVGNSAPPGVETSNWLQWKFDNINQASSLFEARLNFSSAGLDALIDVTGGSEPQDTWVQLNVSRSWWMRVDPPTGVGVDRNWTGNLLIRYRSPTTANTSIFATMSLNAERT